MSEDPDFSEDKAAFPRVVPSVFDEVATGMSLRDYFAAAALTGLTAAADRPPSVGTLVVGAYIIADDMLKAREKQ